MAKPKAPVWLRESFRDGVEELVCGEGRPEKPYPAANPWCWLAQHDPAERPCAGVLERFHFIRRQDVEAAIWQDLYLAVVEEPLPTGETFRAPFLTGEVWDLMDVVAWDARNGALACEEHHRRYDNHQVGLPRDRLVVPYAALPGRVRVFAFERGLDRLLDRFSTSI